MWRHMHVVSHKAYEATWNKATVYKKFLHEVGPKGSF